MPLAGIPDGNSRGAWAWTQVVKLENDARWLLTVAGASPWLISSCCQATTSRRRQVEMRSWP